jgi:hypothetical protein
MMATRSWLIAFLVLFAASATEAAAAQATFCVAPGGSDANPGSESQPFASIERARQAVRAMNKEMAGDILVVLRGGVYRIDRTIAFGPDDSGSGGHNVIYQAQADETPIVSGGKPVVGWQPDQHGRWKAPAPVDDFRQLYVNGVRATRAWGKTPAGLRLAGEDGYTTTALEMADWKNAGDLEFCYAIEWAHTRCKVQSIKREGDKATITMLQPHFTQAKTKEGVNVVAPQQMHIENALELLDEPGEWYLDRAAQAVYYMPRPGEDMRKAEVIAPAVEKLVELRGTLDRPVHNICFAGITFQHGSWLLPNKIGFVDVQANFLLDWKKPMKRAGGLTAVHNQHIKCPSNVVCHAAKAVCFERCTFRKLGSGGIDLEFGAQDNTIVGCRFFDISGSAVQVGDVLKDDHHPDDPRKIVKNNAVANNIIHDVAVEYRGGVGVFVGYTEATVLAHNEIAALPYSGISIGWGWGEEDAGGGDPKYYMPFRYDTPTPAKNNRIEYNHIHDVMRQSNDGGAIYTLGNMPGSILRGNHIHDNGRLDKHRGAPGGIYLDEGSGFIEITGNLVYRVITTAVNYNNRSQNRKATCNEHDNFLGREPEEAKPIVEKAGLEAPYRDLLNAR